MGNTKPTRKSVLVSGPGRNPGQGTGFGSVRPSGRYRFGVPPALRDALGQGETVADGTVVRGAMVSEGWCTAGAPAVTLELYGSLRLKTGCEVLALRAHTLGEAGKVLLRAYPALGGLIRDDATLRDHYRFSLNGLHVVTDPSKPLNDGDHVLLFSASVGG